MRDSVLLGELAVPIPPDRAGARPVEVRFTCETSGPLEVDALAKSTGPRRAVVIGNQPGVLGPEEVAARLRRLTPLEVAGPVRSGAGMEPSRRPGCRDVGCTRTSS